MAIAPINRNDIKVNTETRVRKQTGTLDNSRAFKPVDKCKYSRVLLSLI